MARAFECCLASSISFHLFAFTPETADQSLGAYQNKRHCGFPCNEFGCRAYKSHPGWFTLH